MWNIVLSIAKSKNISMYRLSKMTGISESTLSNYKNGAMPSFETMVKIADALNVSLDEFRTDNYKNIKKSK